MQEDLIGRAGRHDLLLGEAIAEVEAVEQEPDRARDPADQTGGETDQRQHVFRIRPLFLLDHLAGPEQLGQVGEEEQSDKELQVQRVDIFHQPRTDQDRGDRERHEPKEDLPVDGLPENGDPGSGAGERADRQ